MKRFLLLALALCLFGVSAFAQSNTGNLVGTVSDASGVIPGATVVVTSNQTGRERTVVASDSGAFSVPQLDVGTYTVKITAQGHKTFTITDVKIDIAKDYSLNATLEVGDITENVTVVGGADIINSSSGELSNTVTERQIVELPLNGRNPLSLVLLQAGTSSNAQNNTTINGQRSSFTNITRDGLNVQDNFIRANAVDFLPDRPSVDDTGEFTIVTQNAGAESGYGASQVQIVTPRGTNDFHGAAYLYNRNSKFSSNPFFNNAAGVFGPTETAVINGLARAGDPRTPRPFLNRNQFGGKVGGPIIKNKLFFFGGYEGFRLRQSTSALRTTLTPNARNGIFTYTDPTGVTRTVNIFSAPFSGLTGITGINPVIQARVLAALPDAGNTTAAGDQLNTTGYQFSRLQNQDRESVTTRFDFDATDRQAVSAVYTWRKENLQRPDVDLQPGGAANSGFTQVPFGFQTANTKFLALAWRWSPTAALTNEVRGGWQDSKPVFGSTFEPDFFFTTPLISNPESAFQAQGRFTKYYNVQDNAFWVKGDHSLRFGFQSQFFRIEPFGPPSASQSTIPTYTLGGGAVPALTQAQFNAAVGCTAPPSGPNCIPATQLAGFNNLLALLGGLVGSASQQFNATSQTSGFVPNVLPDRNLAYEDHSLYFSDQWRVGPRLTLNLGLRYELFTPIREENGLAVEVVIPSGANVRDVILNPVGQYNFVGTNFGNGRFFKTDKNNFAPIISFAYSPEFQNKFLSRLMPGGGRTVIRGGYRMSYVNDEFVRAADNALAGNQGVSQGVSLTGLNARLNAPPTFTAPTFSMPRTFAQNNALAANFGTVFAIDPDLQVPRSHEFNIGFQREIGWQTAFEARYVHGQSGNLVRGLDLNQINIFQPDFLADFNRARANLLAGFSTPNCTAGTFSGGVACQPLQLFNQAAFFPAGLSNATIQSNIRFGEPGQFAFNMISGFGVPAYSTLVLPNPNTGVVDLIGNFARYNYNALQVEVRRRFSDGLALQANYTFQKTLTDAPGTGQTRFEPLISNQLGGDYEYGIADFDTTHVFNLNAIYELPFGRGKRWFSDANGLMDRLVGGWQFTSIIRWTSGTPLNILDPRGTLNRAGRSTRQTANTNLTKEELKNLIGTFRTGCGVFFVNPQVLNIDLNICNTQGRIASRVAGLTAGVATAGPGQPPFPGQVFFNVPPFQVGNIEHNFLMGPMYFNWDASIIKNIPITERVRFQMRAEVFNVLNRANFFAGQFSTTGSATNNINSSSFGRILGTWTAGGSNQRVIQFVGRIEF